MVNLLTAIDRVGRAEEALRGLAYHQEEAASSYMVRPIAPEHQGLLALLYRGVIVDGQAKGKVEREPVTLARPFEAVTIDFSPSDHSLLFKSKRIPLEAGQDAPRWWDTELGEITEENIGVESTHEMYSSRWTLNIGASGLGLVEVMGVDETGQELWCWSTQGAVAQTAEAPAPATVAYHPV